MRDLAPDQDAAAQRLQRGFPAAQGAKVPLEVWLVAQDERGRLVVIAAEIGQSCGLEQGGHGFGIGRGLRIFRIGHGKYPGRGMHADARRQLAFEQGLHGLRAAAFAIGKVDDLGHGASIGETPHAMLAGQGFWAAAGYRDFGN